MPKEEKVIFIRYRFDEQSLLANPDIDNPHRYEIKDSARKYAELLTQALKDKYPDAEIDVEPYTGGTQIQVEVSSSDDNGFETSEDRSDFFEAEINSIAEEIYAGAKWALKGDWQEIVQASERFGIPAFILRWACKEKLIEGACQVDGVWEFTSQAIAAANREFTWLSFGETLAVTRLGNDGFEFTGFKNMIPSNLASDDQIILTPPRILQIPLFSDSDTLLIMSKLSNYVEIELEHFYEGGKFWLDKVWTYSAYMKAFQNQADRRTNLTCELRKSGGLSVNSLKLRFIFPVTLPAMLQDFISSATSMIRELIQDAELSLSGGPCWKEEYEESGKESLFCQEMLAPLLRRLGFDNVRDTHGSDEFGRDFIFSQQTPFGWPQYYGLQAKVGLISGKAASQIDKIIAQIQDAFSMPFTDLGSDNRLYISVLIVATSGHFTNNAQKKIIDKMPQKGTIGSIYFLDQEKILSLISKYWPSKPE